MFSTLIVSVGSQRKVPYGSEPFPAISFQYTIEKGPSSKPKLLVRWHEPIDTEEWKHCLEEKPDDRMITRLTWLVL